MLLKKIEDCFSTPHKTPKIFVLGDLMIDHHVFGHSFRLSPEAPVPVLLVEKETSTLGGAANVAQNLIGYQANVSICGIIGNDDAGKKILQMLSDDHIDTNFVHLLPNRPTTLKTRLIAGNHHIARVDREVATSLTELLSNEIFEKIKEEIIASEIVVLSDYNKGFLTATLTQLIVQFANQNNKRVIIDPKGADYLKYKGAYIIKPNKRELAKAAQVEKISNREELENAAFKIISLSEVEYLVVTLSEEGIAVFGKDRSVTYFPVKAKEVFDVTGAGDTVIATLAYFLALGLKIEEACELANHAAAIVVKHVGSAVVNIQELKEQIEKDID